MATKNQSDSLMERVTAKVTGRKRAQDSKDDELVAKCNRLYGSAQNARKLLDWKWFIYDLWVSGNHYAKYDRNTQQIVTSVKEDGRPKVVINKVYIVLRAVRNYTLRNKPKAEVTPSDLTPDTVDQTIKLNRYLDYLHDRLDLRRKLKGTTWHALKYSVGYWQVLWDEDGEDGVGEIEVNEVDPYDLYWDPLATHPGEARFCCLAVRRNLADLREDPKYDKYKDQLDDITADKQMAASSMKSRMLQYESGNSLGTSSKDEGSVIVKEFWMKETQKDTGKPKIRIVTLAGEQLIRNELTELDRLPFFRLASDIEPMSMYGQGWAKNIIPVNRLLDRLESQLAEYNDLMNKGKWISDKGAGVKIINNENGQIIEKKRGFTVEQAEIVPPSNVLIAQIQNANRYIEDLGSMHDAIQGRIPPGVESGNAIEALQQGDSNNLSELTENTEQFLEEVYEYILTLASQKYQFARNIAPINNTGQREFISVIGEAAANQPPGATVISKKNMVDVKITSWLASSPQARQNAVKDLAQVMLANQTPLDMQTILEAYETGNIADIVQRIEQQMAQKAQQEAAMQQQQAQAQAQAQAASRPPAPPPPPPPPQAGQPQAIAALRAIISGRAPIIPTGVSADFIATIDQFMHTSEAKQLDPKILDLIQAFRDHVIQQSNGIGGGIPSGQPSAKGSQGPNFFVQ